MKVTVCHNITDSNSSKDQEEIVINLRFGSLIYLYSSFRENRDVHVYTIYYSLASYSCIYQIIAGRWYSFAVIWTIELCSVRHRRCVCPSRWSILSAVRRPCGTSCCPNRGREPSWPVSGWRRFTTCPGEDLPSPGSPMISDDLWWSLTIPDSGSLILRHRAVNLFLQGYEKSWIEAEEHYFEDKLIEDLAVCIFQNLWFP